MDLKYKIHHNTFNMSRCIVCDEQFHKEQKFEIDHYVISDCPKCGYRFLDQEISSAHTSKVYSDEYFEGGGAGYPDYLAEKDILIQRGSDYANILRQYMEPGSQLDVGAAAGFLMEGFRQKGWRNVGIEPNDKMAKYGIDNLKLDIQTGAVEDFKGDSPFDLVTMIQVIPHFYNLKEALENLSQQTRSGGYWLIETWNKDSFTAKAMGKKWHEYSPPSVLHWFTPVTIQRLSSHFGFSKVAQGRLSKKINAAHAKSLINYKFNENKLIKGMTSIIPDSLTIPYPAEDLFWMLLQKKA